jgi:hypothetical protein
VTPAVAYVCQLGCMAECPCRLHLPCEIFGMGPRNRDPHDQVRGKPEHFAYDDETGPGHVWVGKAGRCREVELA